jgi:hypothetical protein
VILNGFAASDVQDFAMGISDFEFYGKLFLPIMNQKG